MEPFLFMEQDPRFLDKHEEREGFVSHYYEFENERRRFRNVVILPKGAKPALSFRFYEKRHGIWFELNEADEAQNGGWFKALTEKLKRELAQRDRVRRLFLKKRAASPQEDGEN